MHAIERETHNGAARVAPTRLDGDPKHTEVAVTAWLVGRLSSLLEVPPETVDIQQTFDEFGVNSVQAISLTGELSEWLGIEVPATALWEFPTIELIARQAAQHCAAPE